MSAVDRYLKNKAMDNIDHALGRPVDPMVETYRNRFAINEGDKLAASFRASPHWHLFGAGVGMLFFSVTTAGRKALRDHLRAIGDRNRLYDVTYGGFTSSVVAVSPAKAKYSHWLNISDCCGDLTFGDYSRTARVRLSPPPSALSQEGAGT